jgi:hypothetical protein
LYERMSGDIDAIGNSVCAHAENKKDITRSVQNQTQSAESAHDARLGEEGNSSSGENTDNRD